MTVPRPTLNDEMKMNAAMVVAEKLGNPQWAAAIARNFHKWMDGYELAKELCRNEGWDVTRDEMEELDEMDSLTRDALQKAEQEWGDSNDIQPPYPLGTKLIVHGVIGEITGVSDHSVASYLVKVDGQDDATCGNRRQIVRFEDAQLAPTGDPK